PRTIAAPRTHECAPRIGAIGSGRMVSTTAESGNAQKRSATRNTSTRPEAPFVDASSTRARAGAPRVSDAPTLSLVEIAGASPGSSRFARTRRLDTHSRSGSSTGVLGAPVRTPRLPRSTNAVVAHHTRREMWGGAAHSPTRAPRRRRTLTVEQHGRFLRRAFERASAAPRLHDSIREQGARGGHGLRRATPAPGARRGAAAPPRHPRRLGPGPVSRLFRHHPVPRHRGADGRLLRPRPA